MKKVIQKSVVMVVCNNCNHEIEFDFYSDNGWLSHETEHYCESCIEDCEICGDTIPKHLLTKDVATLDFEYDDFVFYKNMCNACKDKYIKTLKKLNQDLAE